MTQRSLSLQRIIGASLVVAGCIGSALSQVC